MFILSLVFLLIFGGVHAQQQVPTLNLPSKLPIEGQGKNKIGTSIIIPQFTVMIDAGHGGHDVGTQSISKPRYQEKSLNLVTAKFVRDFLQQSGYRVIMTREDDTFVSLENRAKIANEINPSVFVSIHYNSAPSSDVSGIEIFFYQSKENKERIYKSRKLAQIVLKNIISETDAKSRGVKHGNYLVIRQTKMPAILVEGGFVTNENELEKLKDPIYIKRLAWGITRGIEEYLKNLKMDIGRNG